MRKSVHSCTMDSMKYSRMFGKTQRHDPASASLISHKLLYRGGFIRESTAGRYYFLPLGWRVHEKIRSIIKQEMDAVGAQEMITPILHPLSLWEETNRTHTAGFELMTVKDRRNAQFALGGTAEEMFVDLVRKYSLSYRDLPFNVYQFSTKFRDELRARGGLLRLREFVMKDAYSFHGNETDFKREYERMADTYTRIFNRLGLTTQRVMSDNGYIGGEYSHEFQARCDSGEDTVFSVPGTQFAYNCDVAPAQSQPVSYSESQKPLLEIKGEGITGVENLVKYLGIPIEKTTKTVIFTTKNKKVIVAAVRGDYDINLLKLKRVSGNADLALADSQLVKDLTGAEVGYAGLLNLPDNIDVFIDESCDKRINFECGSNKTGYHLINVNWGRDLARPKEFVDIKIAKEGDVHPQTGKQYEVYRSIEVGNIFQLGYHYSHLMKGATYVDQDGKQKPFYMGCYGIGIARTMAAIVETHHDDKGICWPRSVSPFDVHLISLSGGEDTAQTAYDILTQHGIDVLWDERDEPAGIKFADADLIGIPIRLIASKKTGINIELKSRNSSSSELLPLKSLVVKLSTMQQQSNQ